MAGQDPQHHILEQGEPVSVSAVERQGDLFQAATDVPEGLRYTAEALTRTQEAASGHASADRS